MVKMVSCLIVGAMLGLMFGALAGVVAHNYELNKCKSLVSSTNQDYYNYEVKSDCYFVLEKTEWNLFWFVLVGSIMCALLLGFVAVLFSEV